MKIIAALLLLALASRLAAHGADGPMPVLPAASGCHAAFPAVHSGKGSVPHGATLSAFPAHAASSTLRPWSFNAAGPSDSRLSSLQPPHARRGLAAFDGGGLRLFAPNPAHPAAFGAPGLRHGAGWPRRWPIRPPPSLQSIV